MGAGRRAGLATVLCLAASAATAQTAGGLELGVHLAAVRSGEFAGADAGVGGRLGWRRGLFGLEGEFTFYPGDFPDRVPFTRSRAESLFGVTVGPTRGVLRPFVRLRAGVVRLNEAPRPFPCIRIFPPPLACALADGHTLAAGDIGGGVELALSRRLFGRFDIGDRLVRYPGPAFDGSGDIRDEAFVGHDLRATGGVGIRF